MTGYQEILTDPSYFGQIVAMTAPMIGNYGINLEDNEAPKPMVQGFIVRELSQSLVTGAPVPYLSFWSKTTFPVWKG